MQPAPVVCATAAPGTGEWVKRATGQNAEAWPAVAAVEPTDRMELQKCVAAVKPVLIVLPVTGTGAAAISISISRSTPMDGS
ncbi:MAG: hypothetical protein ACK533_08740 [Planctomycetota bacterium]